MLSGLNDQKTLATGRFVWLVLVLWIEAQTSEPAVSPWWAYRLRSHPVAWCAGVGPSGTSTG